VPGDVDLMWENFWVLGIRGIEVRSLSTSQITKSQNYLRFFPRSLSVVMWRGSSCLVLVSIGWV
jgi:hypothetical protein